MKSLFFRKTIIALCAIVLVTSCSNENEEFETTLRVPIQKSESNCSEIRTIADAKAIAENYLSNSVNCYSYRAKKMSNMNQFTIQVLTRDSLPQKPGDKAPITITPDTLLYSISSIDGTIMIPADKQAPEVIGILDTPTESLSVLLKKNNGDNPLYELLEPVFNPDIYKPYLNDVNFEPFMPFGDIPIGDGNNNDAEERRKRETYIAPKIQVEWDQNYPFNKLCPKRSVAGCVAIATAQAMTLTGVPFSHESYKFDNLSEFKNRYSQYVHPELIDPIAYLIRKIGQVVNMNYEGDKSSAKTKDAVKIFSRMGLNVDTNKRNIKKTLRDFKNGFIMISSNKKSFMGVPTGKGHCYLVDGYKYIAYGYDKLAYLHVNYGWGPEFNGLFLQNIFSPHFVENAPETYPHAWSFYCIY